jgi:ornithine cyclodeaminase
LRIVSEADITRLLTYPALVEALRQAFQAEITVPVRHHHTVPHPAADATLLLMPAWTNDAGARPDAKPDSTFAGRAYTGERFLGCKIVTVFPANAAAGQPSVYGQYLLMSGESGEPLALIDGRALTAWRTAAASALAASFLAREDASHLVMIGAGTLAPHLLRAHAAMRPIRRVMLWNRTQAKAEALAAQLRHEGLDVQVAGSLASAVGGADIVSCATLAAEPLVRGQWLKEGAHVDLVGGFTPRMREADDDALRRARIYVDTRAGALKEAGDIVDPIARGVIGKERVVGDLLDLCRGYVEGRRTATEITLFKSVGTAIEDLAAAMLVWRKLQ